MKLTIGSGRFIKRWTGRDTPSDARTSGTTNHNDTRRDSDGLPTAARLGLFPIPELVCVNRAADPQCHHTRDLGAFKPGSPGPMFPYPAK